MNNLLRPFCALLVVVLNASCVPVQDAPDAPTLASKVPHAPKGFSWKVHQGAMLLKPNGWYERTRNDVWGPIQMSVYAASPQRFSESEQFQLGVTVQVFADIKKLPGMNPTRLAQLYLKPLLDSHKREDILLANRLPRGAVETIVFRYRDAPGKALPIVVHKYLVVNDALDTVHVFTFESPESSWTDHWARYGQPILTNLKLASLGPPPK